MSSQNVHPAQGRQKHCAYCDRTFTKLEHLKRHQRSHTGEKPFKCQKCSRTYARSDVLARHLQTHPINHHNDRRRPRLRPHEDNVSDQISSPRGQHSRRTTDATAARHDHESFFMSVTTVNHERISAPGAEQPRCPTANHRRPLAPQSLLPNISLPGRLPNVLQTPPQQVPNPISPNTCVASRLWDVTMQDSLDQSAHEDWAEIGSDGVFRPTVASPTIEDRTYDDISIGHLQAEVSQPATTQIGNVLPSPFQHNENCEGDQLQDDQDANAASPGLAHFSPPNDPNLSPGMVDWLDFNTPDTSFQMLYFDSQNSSNPPTAFSAEQLRRIRQLWQSQKPRPRSGTRLIRTLWRQVTSHEAGNIFSKPPAPGHDSVSPVPNSRRTSRWSMDDNCRTDLINYCKELDENLRREEVIDTEQDVSHLPSASEDGFGQSPSSVLDTSFPTTEVLDSSLDFFFQFFHPNLPFIHKGTFDARAAPSSLLLSMCLVGLSCLDPGRTTTAFVVRYLGKLMRSCRSELTSKAIGNCPPWELLSLLATTLVVVYLALGFLDNIDECQAHMLCAQMLHIAEKHGLFAADHGGDLTLQQHWGSSDPEGSWKTWARAESIKRMILYLLWLDMAYTRLMSTAGVVEMDKVELHLPCDDVLFEASTSASFLQAAERGAQLIMPRMHIRNFHQTAPSKLNYISVQTLLCALYLQVAAARTRLLIRTNKLSEVSSFIPAEVFVMDSRAKDIVTSILLLPTMYSDALHGRSIMTILAWNDLCIALTVDLDLLEVASGRDGLESASTALVNVAKWSQSASARRAVLHAARIFNILDSTRIRESNIARPDLLLFVSALVLSLYLFVADHMEASLDVSTFELLQDIDWTVIKGEGLVNSTESGRFTPPSNGQQPSDPSSAARDFVRYGGPISFAGESQQGCVAARKVLLRYAHLLHDFDKSHGSKYSQILRTMSDFVIKDGQ